LVGEFGLTLTPLRIMMPQRFRQGGTVIKFFCLNCGQKLAVDDDGIGAVVACTNCGDLIVVPPRSVTESFFAEAAERRRRASQTSAEIMEVLPPANDSGNGTVPAPVRTALIPHLARMMMNRLVQALFAQRASLLDTQTEATQRMAEIEERIARAQTNVEKRVAAYEARIAELERLLAAKEEENHDLKRANFQLARKAIEAENLARAGRVDLRDAGFLLRA
jgi:DNA-directed RNA polymerase subunit M/transcription elongation factor TFIIS